MLTRPAGKSVILLSRALADSGAYGAPQHQCERRVDRSPIPTFQGDQQRRRKPGAEKSPISSNSSAKSFTTPSRKLRVDLGKPLVIFAVKNEDTLKPPSARVLGDKRAIGTPRESLCQARPATTSAVRTNIGRRQSLRSRLPRIHARLMDRNFQGLPVWLGEGLAEYSQTPPFTTRKLKSAKFLPITCRCCNPLA